MTKLLFWPNIIKIKEFLGVYIHFYNLIELNYYKILFVCLSNNYFLVYDLQQTDNDNHPKKRVIYQH